MDAPELARELLGRVSTGETVSPARPPTAERPGIGAWTRQRTGASTSPASGKRGRRHELARAVASATAARCIVSSLICLVMAIYSSEVTLLVRHQAVSHDCGCSSDCPCRGVGNQCTCRRDILSLGAACGCGAQTHTADAPPPPFVGLPAVGPVVMRHDGSVFLSAARLDVSDPGLARKPPHPP